MVFIEYISFNINPHPSPLCPPFPINTRFREGGMGLNKKESAGKTTCGLLFFDYPDSDVCR